jgi:hypothetical protein
MVDRSLSLTDDKPSLTVRLKDFKASELGGIAGKAALAELPKGVEVDQVFFG